MADPANPFVRYIYTRSESVGRSSQYLPSGSQILNDQANVIFDFQVGNLKSDSEISLVCAKLDTRSYTLGSIKEKVWVYQENKPAVGPECKLKVGTEPSGSAAAPASSCLKGPALNTQAVMDSLTARSIGKPKSSPGTKDRFFARK